MLERKEDGTCSYSGRVYVRPVSRGIVLIDHDQDLYVEELMHDGFYHLELSFAPLSKEAAIKANEDLK